MAIFSRRTIQRLINENAKFLTKNQTKNYVKELNNGKLEFEWEVVLLNVFNKMGKVIHDPKFQASEKKIDILFTSRKNDTVSFLADITSVSDQGKDIQYPYDIFEDKLWEKLVEFDLTGIWSYEIGISDNRTSDENIPTLKLPGIAHFETDIFNEEFRLFLSKIKENPQDTYEQKIKNSTADLTIKYKPANNLKVVPNENRINYKINTHRKIYDALYKKYNQLIKTKFDGNLGVILCDRDSKKLTRPIVPTQPKA